MTPTLNDTAAAMTALRTEIERAVVGQRRVVDRVLTALLAGGHVLLEGVPGTGKTLLVQSLGRAIGGRVGRISFTPDLMPADITGTNVLDRRTGEFRLVKGPVFCDVLLADEVNRAPPKTQSALLEAMQEAKATLDGQTHVISPVFTVLATQNPVEFEGTYPLPEAQRDRFLLRVGIDYPEAEQETEILRRAHAGKPSHDPEATPIRQVLTVEDLAAHRRTVTGVRVTDALIDYVRDVVRATRRHDAVGRGGGPRPAVALLVAAKAHALIEGRDYVNPDDVQGLAPDVLGHRLLYVPEAEIEGVGVDDVLRDVFRSVEVPR